MRTYNYACFECRKVFAKPGRYEVVAAEAPPSGAKGKRRPARTRMIWLAEYCPQCQRQMRLMPRYFKAPRQEAVKKWKRLEVLHRSNAYVGRDVDVSYQKLVMGYDIEWRRKSEGEQLLEKFTPPEDKKRRKRKYL